MNMTIMTSLGTIAEIVFVDNGRTWQLLTAYWVYPAKTQPGYRK